MFSSELLQALVLVAVLLYALKETVGSFLGPMVRLLSLSSLLGLFGFRFIGRRSGFSLFSRFSLLSFSFFSLPGSLFFFCLHLLSVGFLSISSILLLFSLLFFSFFSLPGFLFFSLLLLPIVTLAFLALAFVIITLLGSGFFSSVCFFSFLALLGAAGPDGAAELVVVAELDDVFTFPRAAREERVQTDGVAVFVDFPGELAGSGLHEKARAVLQ
jgi:hypothetical protein